MKQVDKQNRNDLTDRTLAVGVMVVNVGDGAAANYGMNCLSDGFQGRALK